MSSTASGYAEEQPRRQPLRLGTDYTPTLEEKRAFQECNNESFWYRSLPISVVSMVVTRALVARGILSPSPRFGARPKVALAGFFGYMVGKVMYMSTCQEKFKRLENSPLGEVLRQRAGMPQQYPQSELADPNPQPYKPESPSQLPNSTLEYECGFSSEQSMDVGKQDDFSAPVQSYLEEEPRRKPVLYEDLRLKNRENYEVTLTQKAETPLKSPERARERPTREVKKNIYGDSWEE